MPTLDVAGLGLLGLLSAGLGGLALRRRKKAESADRS
ncbi:LPXTG cell wall anchor domain-containing protein [Ottowia sp. VDI28]